MSKLLEEVRIASLSDAITYGALSVYRDPMDAVCAALLAHIEQNKRLVGECVELRSGAPIVLVVPEGTALVEGG